MSDSLEVHEIVFRFDVCRPNCWMSSSSLMSLIYFYQLLIHLLIQTNYDAFQSVCRFDIFLYWLLSVFRWSNCLDNYISEQPSKLGRNWRQAFLCDTSWRTIAQEDQPLFILPGWLTTGCQVIVYSIWWMWHNRWREGCSVIQAGFMSLKLMFLCAM